jgi:hypothetical protein
VGAIHNSIPTKLANDLRVKYGLTSFVETGLAQGTSALWAAQLFGKVISIDIDAQYIARFREMYPNSGVQLFEGDSGVWMYSIAYIIDQPAMFWLDGHTDDYTPVLVELIAINTSRQRNVIMIDDWRMFGTCPAWPSRERVLEFAANGGARVCAEIDDVLVVTPC